MKFGTAQPARRLEDIRFLTGQGRYVDDIAPQNALRAWFLRSDRAHADLMAGAGSVTGVALRWGFTHFGRFAESYRARFGISPRDTLAAARGAGYQD